MTDSQFRFGRHYDFHERLADGIVHAIGVVLAVVGVAVLVFQAAVTATGAEVLAVSIYGGGLILSLAVSFVYNMLPHSALKWKLRRADHSAIFILIAATYTPFLQRGTHDPWAMSLLVAMFDLMDIPL